MGHGRVRGPVGFVSAFCPLVPAPPMPNDIPRLVGAVIGHGRSGMTGRWRSQRRGQCPESVPRLPRICLHGLRALPCFCSFVLLRPFFDVLINLFSHVLRGCGVVRPDGQGVAVGGGIGTGSSARMCGLTNFGWLFHFTPSGVGMVPLDAFVFLLALLPVGTRARLVVLCPSYVLAYEWCFGCPGW